MIYLKYFAGILNKKRENKITVEELQEMGETEPLGELFLIKGTYLTVSNRIWHAKWTSPLKIEMKKNRPLCSAIWVLYFPG